jgi:hypothetical protein
MRSHRFFLMALIALFTACASVPKESVELSTTVGRDVTTVYKSHRELAKLLFGRMRQDVNRFVDNVYSPYQIRSAMENDYKNAKSPQESDRKASIILAINNAFKPEASDKLQRQVFESMGAMVSIIQADIEDKRKELLKPLDAQEALVLANIDRNYSQIIYANSIVTGYLASVVKVHDAQNEALTAIGADANLSDVVGKKLATASDTVKSIVQKAEKAEATTESIQTVLKDLKIAISGN